MTRIIKIYSTTGQGGNIETNVTTLGELKPILEDRGINFSNMKMLLGDTKNEVSLDEAVLPTGNFKIFLVPQKTKSGNSELVNLFNRLASTFEEIADVLEHNEGITSPTVVAKTTPSLTAEERADLEELRRLSEQNNW